MNDHTWRGLQALHMSMWSTSRHPRELCSSRISGSCCEMRAVSSAEQHELLWYQLQFTAFTSGAGAGRPVQLFWPPAKETFESGQVATR